MNSLARRVTHKVVGFSSRRARGSVHGPILFRSVRLFSEIKSSSDRWYATKVGLGPLPSRNYLADICERGLAHGKSPHVGERLPTKFT
jgi:hypothetical protein